MTIETPIGVTKIVRLNESELNNAVNVLTLVFVHDPLICDLFNQSSLRWYAKLLLRYAQPLQHTYTTDSLKGVAIWLPPGHYPLNNWKLLQLGLYRFPFHLKLNRLWQALSLFRTIENFHKHDAPEPHWYLSMIGVDPLYQGQGVGGALLQPVLHRADEDGLCCYLETSTEQAVRFYQRHGFEVMQTVELPTNKLCFWTMKRPPINKVL